jgi:excinuclease ABC subunit C
MELKTYAKAREFERAGEIKRQIFALNHIHDVSLIKQENLTEKMLPGSFFRVEAYDVAHFAGKDVVGVMTVVENGVANRAEYRKFKIKENPGVNDTKALKEILSRRLNHDEWHLPNLIVVDGALAQKNAAESVLSEFGYQIAVVAVTKNEYHKPKNILGERVHLVHESEILLANNEAHRYAIGFHKKLRKISNI